MSARARPDGGEGAAPARSGRDLWRVTRALLGGLVAASAMFFLIAVVQTPGLDPPPETAALFLVAATAGVISYLLLDGEGTAGYPAAMLAGGVVLALLGVVLAGTYGPAGPRTNPVGPAAYGTLAAAVIVAAAAGWRREAAAGASTVSSSAP